jgi:chromosome segregation ATPase
MMEGRRADTARRQQRVLRALDKAIADGGEISLSAVARAAGVHRTFLYRHPELLDRVRAAEATTTRPSDDPGEVSKASLLADLGNARARATRQEARIRQLERRLTELLGEQAWTETGLGAPDDIEQLRRQVRTLEERVSELTAELDERTQDLDAARATNRELMTRVNTSGTSRR